MPFPLPAAVRQHESDSGIEQEHRRRRREQGSEGGENAYMYPRVHLTTLAYIKTRTRILDRSITTRRTRSLTGLAIDERRRRSCYLKRNDFGSPSRRSLYYWQPNPLQVRSNQAHAHPQGSKLLRMAAIVFLADYGCNYLRPLRPTRAHELHFVWFL